MSKFKIGINLTYILNESSTGIKKYAEDIITGLYKYNNREYEIIIFVNRHLESYFKNKFTNCKIIPITFWFKDIKYIRRVNIMKFANRIKSNAIKKQKCDLVIYPYVDKHVPMVKKQNKIIVIHDLIPLNIIEDKNSKKYKKIKKENINIMNETNTIVTISQYSKKKLEEINPEYSGKIVVIPNAIEKINDEKKDLKNMNIKQPYIFSINSFFKHKNQITLVKAFNRIKDKIPHDLVLVRKTRN